MLAASGVAAQPSDGAGLHADQARRRRPAEGALVAGADAAQPALRAPAPRTRTARASSTSRWPPSIPTATSCPVLAAEIPSVGRTAALAKDGTWVIWNLKKGVQLARRQAVHRRRRRLQLGVRRRSRHRRASTIGAYRDIDRVEKLDDHTVKVVFKQPHAVLVRGVLRQPRHAHPQAPVRRLSRATSRARRRPTSSPSAPAPTGSWTSSRATSCAARSTRTTTSPTGRSSTRIEMKGGGDAVSAARAVLQTGEFDFAWNMQVEDDILKRLEQGGKGRVEICPTGSHRAHPAQPHRSVDGGRRRALERSRRTHPLLTRSGRAPGAHPAGRPRLGPRADLRPPAARPRRTSSTRPRASARRTRRWEFNVDKANQILDAAGWKRGADGIRAKDGKRLKFLLPDLDQRAAPEDAGHRQAGVRQGRHRGRAQVGGGLGVLLVRSGQPRHLPALLRRSPDVQHRTSAPDPQSVHGAVRLAGGRHARTTSGRGATSPAGGTRSTTGSGRPPRPRWTRSSARRSSSR